MLNRHSQSVTRSGCTGIEEANGLGGNDMEAPNAGLRERRALEVICLCPSSSALRLLFVFRTLLSPSFFPRGRPPNYMIFCTYDPMRLIIVYLCYVLSMLVSIISQTHKCAVIFLSVVVWKISHLFEAVGRVCEGLS